MNKIFLILIAVFLTNTLLAETGTVLLSCDSEGSTIYVDDKRKARVKKGVTIFHVEEGRHTIKVVEYMNSKCQKYVEKEFEVPAKSSVMLSMNMENNVEATDTYTKKSKFTKTTKNQRFSRTSCQLVKDTKLKLMWQDNPRHNRVRNLKLAKSYCAELKLSIFDDWRLPTYEELLSIVDYNHYNSAIIPLFQNSFSARYWSTTQDVAAPNYAWFVDFIYGRTGHAKKSKEYYTRCVRDN